MLSVTELVEELNRLESLGYGDASLELYTLAPLIAGALKLPVGVLKERLEVLEVKGYGEALLELRSIAIAGTQIDLHPENSLSQAISSRSLRLEQQKPEPSLESPLMRLWRHWLNGSKRALMI